MVKENYQMCDVTNKKIVEDTGWEEATGYLYM